MVETLAMADRWGWWAWIPIDNYRAGGRIVWSQCTWRPTRAWAARAALARRRDDMIIHPPRTWQ